MTDRRNDHDQPIGPDVPGWTGCASIPRTAMQGHYCDVVPLETSHSADLHTAYSADKTGALWTYMPTGPFGSLAEVTDWVKACSQSTDPLFVAIIDKRNSKAIGVASFLRMDPANGVAEVGYIAFSPALQKTPMATEAMYLMMRRVLGELGYRRYEWKCDALNAASQAAAKRLGFSYEGTFRQAIVYKGRNRDTAWFSIIDKDWPRIQTAFENWLAPDNFDDNGLQRQRLNALMPDDLQA